MSKEGLILGSTFSSGCQMAKDTGVSDMLVAYSESHGESHEEKEIQEALSRLQSYLFYCVIADANKIEDPFNERVIRAHWIGNELLEKVRLENVLRTVEEFKRKGRDEFQMLYIMKPMIERKCNFHHNVYANGKDDCSVALKEDGYFYHLGKKRVKASQEDIENFNKHRKD